MRNNRVKISLAGLSVVCLMLSALLLTGTSAYAQVVAQNDDVVATCADLAVIGIPEGPQAVAAAERLRARGAPNPPGVEAALDFIVAFADLTTDEPSLDAVEAAFITLDGYFGGACANLDRCPLVAQVVGADSTVAATAAGLLRKLETPSPPGIDAALALIAGEITDSPFHSSIAEAQAQIASYYPCAVVPATSPDPGVLATCADLNVLGIPEGPRVLEAAQSLRARGASNPPGIEAAFDVIVAFADLSTPEPSLADVDAALATLNGYFGGPCQTIDRCPLVTRALSTDPAVAQPAASLLARLEQPAPPGIGAALSFIAGEFESPFHDTVAEAQAQIASYYPCSGLAFTGARSTAGLAMAGFMLVTVGSSLVVARRRILTSS